MLHPSSLQKWISNINLELGFQLRVLQALAELDDKDKDCCLILAMAIKQQITWNAEKHKYVGFCEYGNSISLESTDVEAKDALVFLLVSLKEANGQLHIFLQIKHRRQYYLN